MHISNSTSYCHSILFQCYPGVGVAGNGGILLYSPADSLIETLNIPINSLPNGFNNLFIRDEMNVADGQIPNAEVFILVAIKTQKYYCLSILFDTDPRSRSYRKRSCCASNFY